MHTRSRQARLASLLDGALDSADDVKSKRGAVGLLGLLGHGIYYYLWTEVYPQPYESAALRLALASMFLLFLCPWRWIERAQAAWPVFWHVTLTLNLPTFFTYMALRNDSWLWVGSLQTALLLVYLLTSGPLSVLLIGIGMALGAACAAPSGIDWQRSLLMQAWPVLLFSVVAAALLSRSQQESSRRKTAALMSYAGYIAHELRTPLASIAARASLTRGERPVAGQERDQHLSELSREVQRTFALIDILLTNVDPQRHAAQHDEAAGQAGWERVLISDVVAEALMRYPFQDASERARVQVRIEEDCAVRASGLLLQHVVMNLIRNAFQHCHGSAVTLGITARRNARQCELSIQDNGGGFATDRPGQAGLGLLFCRSVVRSVGGHLRVSSMASGGCTVCLSLPSTDR